MKIFFDINLLKFWSFGERKINSNYILMRTRKNKRKQRRKTRRKRGGGGKIITCPKIYFHNNNHQITTTKPLLMSAWSTYGKNHPLKYLKYKDGSSIDEESNYIHPNIYQKKINFTIDTEKFEKEVECKSLDEIKEELGLDEKNKKTEEKVEEKEAEKVEKEEENIFAEILQQKLTVGYNPIKDNISPSEKTRIINEIIENNKQFPKNKNLTENHWGVLIDALNKINYIKSFTKENIQTRDVTEIQQKYERQQQEQQQKQQQKQKEREQQEQKEREQQEQKEREQKEQKEQKVEYKQQKDYSVDINKWCASDNNTQQYCENENIKSKTSADQQKLVDQYENNLLYGGRKRKTKRRRRRGGVKSPTKIHQQKNHQQKNH